MSRASDRREALASQWRDLGPHTAHTLPRALWGISPYFDANTRNWFRSRVLSAYAWEHSPTGTVLVIARETLPEYHDRSRPLHRVVIIIGRKGGPRTTHRIDCRNARRSDKVYREQLRALTPCGNWTRRPGWTLRALTAHINALELASHTSRIAAVSEARS